jgi:hypothetical protein
MSFFLNFQLYFFLALFQSAARESELRAEDDQSFLRALKFTIDKEGASSSSGSEARARASTGAPTAASAAAAAGSSTSTSSSSSSGALSAAAALLRAGKVNSLVLISFDLLPHVVLFSHCTLFLSNLFLSVSPSLFLFYNSFPFSQTGSSADLLSSKLTIDSLRASSSASSSSSSLSSSSSSSATAAAAAAVASSSASSSSSAVGAVSGDGVTLPGAKKPELERRKTQTQAAVKDFFQSLLSQPSSSSSSAAGAAGGARALSASLTGSAGV